MAAHCTYGTADLGRLGNEIAELSAHLDAAAGRLLAHARAGRAPWLGERLDLARADRRLAPRGPGLAARHLTSLHGTPLSRP